MNRVQLKATMAESPFENPIEKEEGNEKLNFQPRSDPDTAKNAC